MEFQDKTLTCVDCGAEFVWTAGEQLFFADKNFKNEPKRCKACKAKRANRPGGGAPGPRERVETLAVCSACGKEFPRAETAAAFCSRCGSSLAPDARFCAQCGHGREPGPDAG